MVSYWKSEWLAGRWQGLGGLFWIFWIFVLVVEKDESLLVSFCWVRICNKPATFSNLLSIWDITSLSLNVLSVF